MCPVPSRRLRLATRVSVQLLYIASASILLREHHQADVCGDDQKEESSWVPEWRVRPVAINKTFPSCFSGDKEESNTILYVIVSLQRSKQFIIYQIILQR
uniref:Uncharacterized protein n=1 Tax=Timema bartmani TaxID=61472 RepID=A0A7R9HZM2_9NEOP|nr:unnamed protein product [Timema bartmani]